jgi:hypothetical protein
MQDSLNSIVETVRPLVGAVAGDLDADATTRCIARLGVASRELRTLAAVDGSAEARLAADAARDAAHALRGSHPAAAHRVLLACFRALLRAQLAPIGKEPDEERGAPRYCRHCDVMAVPGSCCTASERRPMATSAPYAHPGGPA